MIPSGLGRRQPATWAGTARASVQPVVGHRRVGDLPQRQDPGPDGQVVVGLVVDRRPGADLGRDLDQREGEHGGGRQLTAVAPADRVAAAGNDVLDQGAQGGFLLVGVGDRLGAADGHHRPVVHRVMEGRAGQHQAVHQGDGDADVHLRPQAEAAPGGTVQVERVAGPRVAGRDDVRLAAGHEPDVADEALVEDGVHRGPVVGGPLRQASDPGPLGSWVLVSVHGKCAPVRN